jgi:hypothetical protein
LESGTIPCMQLPRGMRHTPSYFQKRSQRGHSDQGRACCLLKHSMANALLSSSLDNRLEEKEGGDKNIHLGAGRGTCVNESRLPLTHSRSHSPKSRGAHRYVDAGSWQLGPRGNGRTSTQDGGVSLFPCRPFGPRDASQTAGVGLRQLDLSAALALPRTPLAPSSGHPDSRNRGV